jgi:DNA polymerase III delta subunit
MPRANVFFFTGEHAYALHEELVRWKKQFAEKHGEENLLLLEGKKISKNDLIDAVSVLPFLAEKRLIVIDGVPSLEKGDLFLVLDACHEQSVLVICEGVPDKRLSTVKPGKIRRSHLSSLRTGKVGTQSYKRNVESPLN